ncbi:N-acetyltransferase [Marinilactibacillus sp. XAAS-LB27]|uniref:GNAT family N-acetyltransferase n=1 Tax=Marinilactibacillus sp. XAAS-LB27 TaxID=3114538 RepID=UPI002E18C28F|nr:N-acetyltransferase [Marinilactibacillus sp. XAAS-LB27]
MVEINKCELKDVDTLQEISIETFRETFQEQNTPEHMNDYLENAYNPKKLEQEISNPYSFFYFLYVNLKIAGYLKVNIDSAQTEVMGNDTLEIERIYLKKDFQELGLGTYLINKAEAVAREKNKSKIWLGVWEKNEKALIFYQKKGFSRVGQHSFFMGNDEQTDLIMLKKLYNPVPIVQNVND